MFQVDNKDKQNDVSTTFFHNPFQAKIAFHTETSHLICTANIMIWDKILKNGQSKICGRQPLKILTWSILQYFVPYVSI